MKYKPERSYDLVPGGGKEKKDTENASLTTSRLNELEKLKELFDKNVLTEEEYKIEKQKILNK